MDNYLILLGYDAKLTRGKVSYCYDLIDAAYDAAQNWEQSKTLVHMPIIDRNPRGMTLFPWRHTKPLATMSGRVSSAAMGELGVRYVQVRECI
jgi:hypothetical protein